MARSAAKATSRRAHDQTRDPDAPPPVEKRGAAFKLRLLALAVLATALVLMRRWSPLRADSAKLRLVKR